MTNNDIDTVGSMEYEYIEKKWPTERFTLIKFNNRLEKLCENLNINSTRVMKYHPENV